ncbi:hypothetical protein B9T65_25205 [Serratia marcescens]|nr:hypothetical protein B9T65_25205 [Serratia marcescens]
MKFQLHMLESWNTQSQKVLQLSVCKCRLMVKGKSFFLTLKAVRQKAIQTTTKFREFFSTKLTRCLLNNLHRVAKATHFIWCQYDK